MAPWWWSWLLMSVGVTGLWLAGRKSMWGWAIGFGSQLLWLAYSISSEQWGFLASCFAYGAVHARNYLRWRREAQAAEQEEEEAEVNEVVKDQLNGPLRTRIKVAVDRDMTAAEQARRRGEVHDLKTRESRSARKQKG